MRLWRARLLFLSTLCHVLLEAMMPPFHTQHMPTTNPETSDRSRKSINNWLYCWLICLQQGWWPHFSYAESTSTWKKDLSHNQSMLIWVLHGFLQTTPGCFGATYCDSGVLSLRVSTFLQTTPGHVNRKVERCSEGNFGISSVNRRSCAERPAHQCLSFALMLARIKPGNCFSTA